MQLVRLSALAAIFALLVGIEAEARSGGGRYIGGSGSSHKGGHYYNPTTGNHYQRRNGVSPSLSNSGRVGGPSSNSSGAGIAASTAAVTRPDAPYLAGLAALDDGDYEQAIVHFTTVIQGDDHSDELFSYLKRATAYEKKGDRNSAIKDYRKALTLTRDGDTKKEINAAITRLAAKQ
jgi:tetratricopeptide (TPR) repeat protein